VSVAFFQLRAPVVKFPLFSRLSDAIKDEINRKLANKVLLHVGLCIALKDIIKIADSIILPGDGASHTEVFFRYIVFRPMIGDVITGKIRSCSREGVHVTLGFFDDILIPPAALQHPSRFEEAEQAWIWEYPLDEGKHDLYMDIGAPVKFRVSGETFEESSPIGPPVSETQPTTSATATAEAKVPFKIIAAINEAGLGLLSWWDTPAEEATEPGDSGDEGQEEGYDE
jgi:DNA-directed RNA polymerase III subunit RPC8